MNYTYTVFWDTRSGYDLDESYTSPLPAFRRYLRLDAPYKKIVVTDRVNGDRTLLTSSGTDNLDRYGLRYLLDWAK